ncbi:MAG: 30S ribosomal protein S6 [Phascolarctobacterium sp.]|nr:30S ribosomal protein S6 [Phascolarctobacterium sp.]
MKKYEVLYVVKPVEDEVLNGIVKKFEDLITAKGGTVEKTDRWGKKHLAYEIEDNQEGLYVLVTFNGSAECVAELDRVMRITEELLRHMIVAKNEKKAEKGEEKDE